MLAAGLPVIGYGLIFNLGLAAVGGLIVVIAGFGWGYEPADDPEACSPHDHDGDDPADGAGTSIEPTDEADGDSGKPPRRARAGRRVRVQGASTAAGSDEKGVLR